MRYTIKDILFEYVRKNDGLVLYEELTKIILSKFPNSEWKKTHWAWYKNQICSTNGKYYDLFPEKVRINLKSNNKINHYQGNDIFCQHSNIATADLHEFTDYSKSVEKEIAIALAKVCYHIHPRIVDIIIKDNIDFKKEFLEFFNDNDEKKSFLAEIFFYEGSDCVFPGVRRPINKEKKGRWKNNLNVEDYTIFNDNTIPRHIWAFLSQGKPYEGNMWARSGLEKFELAHIFGHKKGEKRLEKKVFDIFYESRVPYAYFTSASNVVLIPNGLMKPTDTFETIKIAFYKRHIDLYGENVFYVENRLNEKYVPEWYSEIKWQEPPLPIGWENKIRNLLQYRRQFLRRKYKNSEPSMAESQTNYV